MTGSSAWLRRRDPGLLTVRRAARVTLVACGGFYLCRYGLDNPVMAPYALFGAVALGMLSQIPGSPRQRARTLLAVLPVAWLLITLGTLLSVDDWAAAAGMFVLGFAVSFVGVGGPRLVGLAAGMQLLYILPCFPPYDPGSLGYRLAGVTLAVVLLAGGRAGALAGSGADPVPAGAWPTRSAPGRLPGRGGRHLVRRPARPGPAGRPAARSHRRGRGASGRPTCRSATARRRRAGPIARSAPRPAPPG